MCCDTNRDHSIVCVVESPADVLAIEHTGHFCGQYFVLHGHLSPIDGVHPEDLRIPHLIQRSRSESISEIILATNSTIEGDATALYIANQLQHSDTTCTRIASGIPMGGEIEYLDGKTVCQAIMARSQLKMSEA